MYQLIDGKKISEIIKAEIAQEVKIMEQSGKKIPHLAAVHVGNDPASQTYVSSKVKTCAQVGFNSTLLKFEADITETELLKIINDLNNDSDIDGFIVQLPLPKHISEEKIITAVSPLKDVDGFHPENVGKITLGLPALVSATPAGIVELLVRYNIETAGKHCVILGRSNIVGRPLSILLSQKSSAGDATVTVCHSRTKNLKEITKTADILIAAIGSPEFVTADMVKEGAVVVDVGIHRIASPETKSGTKLTGDVKFSEVAPKCSFITPVPGGVGPMTIVSLMKNTLWAAKNKQIISE